jgi:hypothetical protein
MRFVDGDSADIADVPQSKSTVLFKICRVQFTVG